MNADSLRGCSPTTPQFRAGNVQSSKQTSLPVVAGRPAGWTESIWSIQPWAQAVRAQVNLAIGAARPFQMEY